MEESMSQFVKPEILRIPLENLCLSIKAMRDDEDPKVSLLVIATLGSLLTQIGIPWPSDRSSIDSHH